MYNRTKKLSLVLAAAGAELLLLGGVALAAPGVEDAEVNTAKSQTRSQVIHATSTVSSIDRAGRSVLLKSDDGAETWVSVPGSVKAFDKLKTGDKVDVDYYQSLAVSLQPTGTKPTKTETQAGAVDLGGGVQGRELTISAAVVGVDQSAETVTFKGPKGRVRTVHVENPALQGKLASLKPGQVVQFDYTEAVAADIRPTK